MKRISGLIFLLAIQTGHGGEPYHFKTLEANPIPKDEVFKMLREGALRTCQDAVTVFNTQPDLCRKIVLARDPVCVKKLSRKAPKIFSQRPIAREIAKDYFDCVGPGYFCNGIEVKGEEQFNNHCLDLNQPPMG